LKKTKLIFATGNKGKLKEVQKIFADTEFEIVSLYDLGDVPEIEENGITYAENALIKAKVIFGIHKMPVIADDSGLSVEQLNGEPGVYSARYAGENCTYDDNNKKLIKELEKFDKPHLAKFICSAVFYDGKNIITSLGEFHGEIISEFKGEHGFGYDPIFVPKNSKRTLAEYSSQEKNKVSHRAIAFEKLKAKLLQFNLDKKYFF